MLMHQGCCCHKQCRCCCCCCWWWWWWWWCWTWWCPQCLSCWAFAAASAMESAAAIAGQPLQPLSEQLLVDCVKEGAYGCRGGWHHSAYLWASQNGAVGDLAHPYTQRDGPICPAMIGMAFPIDGYVDVPRNKDELKTVSCARERESNSSQPAVPEADAPACLQEP
jgi:hypothetical protein